MLRFFTIVIGTKLLTIVLGLLYFKFLEKPYRVLLFQTFLALFVESLGFYIIHELHSFNLWLYNLYMLVEAVLLGYVAILLLQNKIAKQVVLSAIIGCAGLWLYCILQDGLFKFANISLIANCLVLCITYVYVLISRSLSADIDMFSDPVSWLCLSAIVFFGCDLPFMTMLNTIVQGYLERTLKLKFIDVNGLLNIFRYLLLAVSFFIFGVQAKKKQLQTA